MNLAYLMMGLPFGAPYTLDQAYPFIQDAMVVFGFPDIIFKPDDAFTMLLNRHAESKADVVLGIFPAHQPQKMDMVELDSDGRIREIVIKPEKSNLHYTWIIGVWTAVFTEFMHDFLSDRQKSENTHQVGKGGETTQELFVGDVLQAAIDAKMLVDSVIFDGGKYLDIGTPEDMYKAARMANEFQEVFK
jgi:glucose-1-phosphate thymidylyltransferase